MQRHQVPTPSLLLDLPAMERNIAVMVAHARRVGVALRPHAKAHKCVQIAHRLIAAGMLGPSVATIAEAEAMAAGGIDDILLTTPLVTTEALDRLRRLLLRGCRPTLVVDQRRAVEDLAAIARTCGCVLPLVVELDVGQRRTGCRNVADAVQLAHDVSGTMGASFAGVQAYWGHLQHLMPFEERERQVMEQGARVREFVDALRRSSLPAGLVTGGGTGTSWLDPHAAPFTELQPGSFLFLDSCYGAIPLTSRGNPLSPALFVAASVISANQPGYVVINAGLKAFATDSGNPLPLRGAPQGATYRFMGDEHGAVHGAEAAGSLPPIGAMIELLTSHCDPTVNLYDAFHVIVEDEVVDRWPIAARGYST
jgi:D-serine deaminase-like pyridoxal phosphate-dependent protein